MKALINTHAVQTAAHGVTGDLVGTSDTQTLTNKTLTSATLNTPTISGASMTPKNASYTADGAITIATSGVAFIGKTSAAAMTVAAPSSQDGTTITIVSYTDFAHVITFTGGTLLDGTTGANTTATFAAFAGASVTVIAKGTTWLVESSNQCTIAP